MRILKASIFGLLALLIFIYSTPVRAICSSSMGMVEFRRCYDIQRSEEWEKIQRQNREELNRLQTEYNTSYKQVQDDLELSKLRSESALRNSYSDSASKTMKLYNSLNVSSDSALRRIYSNRDAEIDFSNSMYNLTIRRNEIQKKITDLGGSTGITRVRGYLRSNGTYVAPYYKTTPDSTIMNNWSTKGNVNPFTGKRGYTQY